MLDLPTKIMADATNSQSQVRRTLMHLIMTIHSWMMSQVAFAGCAYEKRKMRELCCHFCAPALHDVEQSPCTANNSGHQKITFLSIVALVVLGGAVNCRVPRTASSCLNHLDNHDGGSGLQENELTGSRTECFAI